MEKTMDIYRVEWQEKWTNCDDWMRNDANVAASDAESAIRKAKDYALEQSYKQDAQDGGKTCKVTGFRLKGVQLVASTTL